MKNNWGLEEGQEQSIYRGTIQRTIVIDNAGPGTITVVGSDDVGEFKVYPSNAVAVFTFSVTLKGDPDGSTGSWWFQYQTRSEKEDD